LRRPYSFIIRLKNRIVKAKTKVMQIAAQYATLEVALEIELLNVLQEPLLPAENSINLSSVKKNQ
jgi:hypothetical protein